MDLSTVKWELIKRDPLGKMFDGALLGLVNDHNAIDKLTPGERSRYLRALGFPPDTSRPEVDRLWEGLCRMADLIRDKWRVRVHLGERPFSRPLQPFGGWSVEDCSKPLVWPLYYKGFFEALLKTHNDIHRLKSFIESELFGYFWGEGVDDPFHAPLFGHPYLPIVVDLNSINLKDISKVLGEIKEIIREAKKTQKQDPITKHPEWEKWLLHMRPATLRKHLRWYDIYDGLSDVSGISLRAVAYLENLSKFKDKNALTIISTIKSQLGFRFPELGSSKDKAHENNVARAIQKIYWIIHREPRSVPPGRKKETLKPPPLKRVSLEKAERTQTHPGRHTKRKRIDY